jgi:transposase
VRVVDVFVDALNLHELGFDGAEPAATGRPSYHPAVLLKIYIYGYFNQVQSSRRLERECQRNVELMWLTGRLAPDFKTIADFRKDHGDAIRKVCREFVVLCRRLKLFADGIVAVDGSKFKAVNNRDKNFTDRYVCSSSSKTLAATWLSSTVPTVIRPSFFRNEWHGSRRRSRRSRTRCESSVRLGSKCAIHRRPRSR